MAPVDFPTAIDCADRTYALRVAPERDSCSTILHFVPEKARGCPNFVRAGEVAYWADTVKRGGRWRCLECAEIMIRQNIAHPRPR